VSGPKRRKTFWKLAASQVEPDRSRRRVLRDAGIYLIVSTLVLLGLRALPETAWVASQRDRVMDWMVGIHAGTEPEGYTAPPLVFVDLDEPLYRAWGEPVRVPLGAIAGLLEATAASAPAAVILDVDLRGEAPSDASALERVLEDLGGGPTPILLARGFRAPLVPHPRGYLEEVPSFLDPIVARAPSLRWASTVFVRDRDWVVRRYRSFEATCTKGRANVLPAVHVLAVARVSAGAKGVARLDDALATQRPQCDGSDVEPPEDTRASFGDIEVVFSSGPVASRILYGTRAPAPRAPFASARVAFRGREVPIFTRVPASLLLEPDKPVDPQLLAGRIAVIGASYGASRDIHRTPVGDMPGAAILMNSTYSLLQFGALRTPSGGLVVATQVTILAMLSLVFARLPLYWSLTVGPAVIAVVLVPFSLWLFRHGLWLDFAIPLLMLQVLALLRKHGDRISDMRRQLRSMREAGAQ
jgi:CHASE2 domain-containing sensor protein